MEILLLLGLLVLWAKHQALSHRVKALEEEKAQLAHGVLPDEDFTDPLLARRTAGADIGSEPAPAAAAEPAIEVAEPVEPVAALSAGETWAACSSASSADGC